MVHPPFFTVHHMEGRFHERISPFCTNAQKKCIMGVQNTFTFTLYSFLKIK